ncbi:MFS transporter [Kocuria massiliensis]|uniref:MFS transporter n=1 Tax=Kocuria massiliensis TaxID=1926282 RepID=UPI0022B9CE59|nr:MFS transporter [Kocuria massiliensis]
MKSNVNTNLKDELPDSPRRLRADDCVVVDKPRLVRSQIGAGVGNFMEWYDVGVYGYLATTMAQVFTAGMGETVGLLVTLFGFAVSFLVRPLGGMILGPLGDRIGRRSVMLFTLMMMATATVLIGCLPGANSIGIWAVVLLYVLRMVQGFSTGGEYAGAATYVSEYAPDRSRGVWTSLLNSGSQLGFAAGAGVGAATTAISTNLWGENAMVDGAWRIPFLFALVLGIASLLVRNGITESPSFEKAREVKEKPGTSRIFVRHNLRNVIRYYWPQIVIGIAIIGADGACSYTLTSYMPTYLETQIGMATVHTATATVVILLMQAVLLPISAKISDRIGRRPMYFCAAISNLILLIPAFVLFHTGSLWGLYAGLILIMIPGTMYLSINAAVQSELFPTASRYAGVGLTQNFAVSIIGGTVPLISQLLVDITGNSYVSAFYVMFFSVLAIVATLFLRESAGRPLIGSVPVVATRREAVQLEKGQDEDESIDTSTMLLN